MSTSSRSGRSDSSPFRVLARRRTMVVAFTLLGLIAGIVYQSVATRTYTVSAQVQVRQAVAGKPRDSAAPGELFHATQAQIMRSTAVLALASSKPGTEDMTTFANVRNRIAYLKDNLEIVPGKTNELITISLTTPHPEEGKRIISAVIEAFDGFQVNQKKAIEDELLAALLQEKNRVDNELARVRIDLSAQRARDGVLTSDAAPENSNPRLDALQAALAKAELETIDRKAAYTAAVAMLGVDDSEKVDRALPSGVVTDGELDLIRDEISTLQRRLTQQSRIYLPSHPSIREINDRISQLNLQYVAALKQKWVQAQQREGDVRRSVSEEVARASTQRQQAEAIRGLERDQERLTSTSAELNRKIKDISVSVDSSVVTTNVVEEPEYKANEYQPNPLVVIPALALAGLAIGVITSLGFESANPRLATPEGVRLALGTPVLGTIPTSAVRSIDALGWSVHADATSNVAEAFRAVRTSLQFGLGESGGKRVVITSPDQMDGKSTLASNLAIALAKSGKNVLLIDANLRDPAQHRIFGVSDAVGMVDVLANGELNERAIRRTTVEHLHVMPAGCVPRNPSEILNSSGLGEMLEQAAAKYDFVLVDTPAVGVVDDARIVAASCDGAILVIRSGKTNRRLAASARDGLLSVGCNVLGIVVNGCRTSGFGAHGQITNRPSVLIPTTGKPTEDANSAASSTQAFDESI